MPQQLGAVTLVVRDYDEAIAHYCGDLGFDLLEDTDLEDPRVEPYGTVAVFEDRHGITWDLIQPASP